MARTGRRAPALATLGAELLVGLLAAGMASALPAATLRVSVLTPAGKPVPDAVVSLAPVGHAVPPAGTAGAPVMRQRGERFEPFVLAIAAGSAVRFPNEDPIRHHVFSFSPVKPFEIRLYGREQVPEVTFDRPGVVALGCNIHDEMRGYIAVMAEPLFGVTDARGELRLDRLPPGRYEAVVWHPGLKSREPARIRQAVAVPAGGDPVPLRFQVVVGSPGRPAPPDPERGAY